MSRVRIAGGGGASSGGGDNSAAKVASLERQLQEREFHLAELIDEVVYSEGEAQKAASALEEAEKRLAATAGCLEDVVTYAARLEQDVILPALLDLNDVLRKREDLANARRRGVSSLDALPTAHVSPQFQKILEQLKTPSPPVAEALRRRQDASSMALQRNSVATDAEDAFAIAEALIASRQQLSALLSDARRRSSSATGRNEKEKDGGIGAEPSSPMATSASIVDAGVALELRKDLDETRALLRKTQEERDVLSKKLRDDAGSPGAFTLLQNQWHTERATLQQRVRSLEKAIEDGRKERIDAQAREEAVREELAQATQERTLLEQEVRQMRDERLRHAELGGHHHKAGGRATAGFGAAERFGDAEHELRMELDRVVREHSSHVTQLQSEIAMLRSEAGAARRDRGLDDAQQRQIEQLRRNNELLKRDVSTLQQKMASSSRRGMGGGHLDSSSRGNDSSFLSGGAADDEGTSLALEAKVRGFERTIAQLTQELGNVDRRIADVQEQHKAEKRRLVEAFDAERRQYQLEREECDALVLKMTAELEFLVRENANFRARND